MKHELMQKVNAKAKELGHRLDAFKEIGGVMIATCKYKACQCSVWIDQDNIIIGSAFKQPCQNYNKFNHSAGISDKCINKIPGKKTNSLAGV